MNSRPAFIHVDGNNFYCSCERVWRPELHGVPVVVAGSNDGCVIARSDEAKAMGIKMGEPVHLLREQHWRSNLTVCSANFALYGDMSRRMMQTIATLSPRVSVYSIDELFSICDGMSDEQLYSLALQIRARVREWTGIGVGVGVGPTLTLAKLANYAAKAAMTRELHPDYPSTDVYQALVNAALIACCPDGNVIDHLITGLPTSQSKQQHLVDALEKRLIGIHKVAPSREIEVKKVSVIAQPTGTYCDILSFHPDGDMFSESNVLILDPGFFSVDWVAFVDGDLHRDTSESSLIAMSVMLEKLNEAIAKTHGGNGPGIEKLEIALQQGRESVVMYGERVLLKPFIDSVSSAVATQALQDLKVQMRHMQNREIDFLLLGGGGCSFYAEAAKELFPKAKVIMAENPITSNARGYWLYGAQ